MSNKSFVTGANGHLGNNLVRILISKGDSVKAGIRNRERKNVLTNLDCEIVYADLLDQSLLVKAFSGVDTLYQVGAVFKHWASNPKKDIYEANMIATRNVMEAAAESGVKKILFVSSLGTLDRSKIPITEDTWYQGTSNIYFKSKTDSEKLAWQLADKHKLKMISVLPSAMIGENCVSLTPTMMLLHTILKGKLSANPGFYFNFVDIKDIAEGCWLAATTGRVGERYLLANENFTGIDELVRIAQKLYPDRKIKTPPKPPKPVVYLIASLMEFVSKLNRKEPELQRNFLGVFSVKEVCDITKARNELGFNPKPPQDVIESTFRYLIKKHF